MQVKFARAIVAGAAAFGLAVATPSAAEAQMGFVVQANYGEHTDFGAGAGVNFDLGSLTANNGIRGEATFDYYFPGCEGCGDHTDYTYWEINGNLMMDIKSVAGLYVGAGVNYGNSSFSFDDNDVCDIVDCDTGGSDIGLNLMGGWKFGGGPFVQAKFEVGGGEQLVITAGYRF